MNAPSAGINGEPTVVSLFAGCGGSSLGYRWAGFRELLAVDFDGHAVETFRLNFPDVPCWQRDIREVIAKEILEFCGIKEGELDVLDGSPPCQGFSTAGKRKVLDERNDLAFEFARLVKGIQPKAFVMENVSGLVKGRMKGLFREIMLRLKKTGYHVECRMLNAMWHGVPQSRERLIWIGMCDERKIEWPEKQKIIPVKQALKDARNETFLEPHSKYIDLMNDLHPGQNLSKTMKGSHYSYVRLPWNRPSMTMTKSTTFGKISMWHFAESRNITIEEAKSLQSFPFDFALSGSYEEQWAKLGNSVPPKMMEAIALSVREALGYGSRILAGPG